MSSRKTLRYEIRPNAPISIAFAACTQEPGTWREEIDAAARSIAEKTVKPIWVAASGGIDSEVVCEAFHRLGIPFSVLTVAYSNGENEHDISYIRQWCRVRGVKQHVQELDFAAFVKTEMRALVEEGYAGLRPFRYMQIKYLQLIDSFGGFGVLGGGEQLYDVDRTKALLEPTDPFLRFDGSIACVLEWCRNNRADHEPYFFYSTPEIALSWMRDPYVDFVLRHPEALRHQSNAMALKAFVVRANFPNQQWRPKYDGYEHLMHIVREEESRQRSRFGERLRGITIPVVEARRQLEGR